MSQHPSMASRNGPSSQDFDIHVDNGPRVDSITASHPISTPANSSVLGDLAINKIHDLSRPTLESVVSGIEKLHITPENENIRDRAPPNPQDSKTQPYGSSQQTLCALRAAQDTENVPGLQEGSNPLARASLNLPTNQEQLIKHLAGQFDWVLSVPLRRDLDTTSRTHNSNGRRSSTGPSGRRRLAYFGCNIVERGRYSGRRKPGRNQERTANSYILLATPIHGDEDPAPGARTATGKTGDLIQRETPRKLEKSKKMTELGADGDLTHKASELSLDYASDHVADHAGPSPLLSADSPRIEDSFEALDELEDQLEAVNEVTHLDRVLPHQQADSAAPPSDGPEQARPTRAKAGPKPGSDTAKLDDSTHGTTAASTGKDDGKVTGNAKQKRLSVARPASLLPPKPLAKSSKRPTLSTFELPGEAVARRLKEQREARLSMQVTTEQAAAAAVAASPPKPRSSKPPTRPTFELPGEAISRRKREERQAKLREQEEQERKRREFKARPFRSSLVPGTLPRETIASRARQSKVAPSENPSKAPPTVNKRNSLAVSSTGRPTMASAGWQTGWQRGRPETVRSPSNAQMSRTTSSSTGSGQGSSSGKRSTLSAEEAQQQKLRGREIYTRDNSYATDRERERREREALARQARLEAAERSRQLSREWAEKQKLKKTTAG